MDDLIKLLDKEIRYISHEIIGAEIHVQIQSAEREQKARIADNRAIKSILGASVG